MTSSKSQLALTNPDLTVGFFTSNTTKIGSIKSIAMKATDFDLIRSNIKLGRRK